ncbi:MAG: SHOCT domain-containing protein [Candidatus Cyclobacteriaceae bacterium M3_2C_046]
MMHDGYGFWGMGWIWWLIIIVIVALIVWAVVNAGSRRPSGAPHARETALEVLERRYAKGAISTEEYRERKKELTGKG